MNSIVNYFILCMAVVYILSCPGASLSLSKSNLIRNQTISATATRGRKNGGTSDVVRIAMVWVFHDVPPYYFRFALKTFAMHGKVMPIDIHLVCGENITKGRYATEYRSGRLHSHRFYVHAVSDEGWRTRIFDRLGVRLPYAVSEHPRKLADIKPMLGVLLDDLIPSFKYDYWVYGDTDGFFGSIEQVLDLNAVRKYDVISGYVPRFPDLNIFGFDTTKHYALGSFTMLRNIPKINSLFMRSVNYQEVLSDPNHYFHFDENSGVEKEHEESFHQVLALSDDVRKCCLSARIPQVLLDLKSSIIVLDLEAEFLERNVTTTIRWEVNKPIVFTISTYQPGTTTIVTERISSFFVHLLQWKFVRPTLYKKVFMAFIDKVESLPTGYDQLKCFELSTNGALYLTDSLYKFSFC